MKEELCKVDNKPIKVMAHRGTGFCSIDCRKKAGDDVSSVGTIMFVTTDERHKIEKRREKNAQA